MEPGTFHNAQGVTIVEREKAKKWAILKGIVNVGLTKSIESPMGVPSPVDATGM